ncbi:hypothetical protein H8L32_14985 [Undibacterium sp. CY18W]|uniref:Uncharacterized protein n=1 Tax=Undibacterium hunanense TaxID=2762292 RepID=A0ABR6ZSH0_9BURK|nr:hypothetical protein [Undibacterium hunanense]MBC3918797.1 hypothetical protein [Undibacterium hunanense]
MTLTVTVIYVDELTWRFANEIPLSAGAKLAGPEQWRNSVYGSQRSAELGLSLLYALKHQNILVLGSDIVTLKTEVTALLDALDHDETYQHRMGNIIRACELASAQGAAVWIA